MTPAGLPAEAYAAALSALPSMSARRLGMILARWDAVTAWSVVRRGADAWLVTLCGPKGVPAAWRQADESLPEQVWQRCTQLGVRVAIVSGATQLADLADDRQAPGVLFHLGELDRLTRRRVAIVGTRNATDGGRQLAARLGRGLAEAGVAVVSGLARGIDGAAHRAVVDAHGGPVAVVGSGLDVVYPRQHRDLWSQVAGQGLLLSEYPPGTSPLPEHFPQRNRIIAALSEVLVVVESRERGGAMITVEAALARGRTVMAVPGSPLSGAAAGTNRLIADGATPVCDVDDVLLALGLTVGDQRLAFDPRPAPTGDERVVLSAFGGDTLGLGDVLVRSGLGLLPAASALGWLEASGWLRREGGWYQQVGVRDVNPPVDGVVEGRHG